MRHIFSIIIIIIPVCLLSQTTTQNYTVTTIPYQEINDLTILSETNSNSTIQYYDGIGRLSQTIHKAISPTGADLIGAVEYDALGRLSKSWLPAVVQNNNGSYYQGYATQAVISNLNDSKPYSTTEYEASPLNRVVSRTGPGNVWYAGSKKVTKSYILNDANVKYFYVESDKLKCNGYYAAATLYGVQTTDEDGKTAIEYTDKQGRIVLNRVAGNYDTYYVYDDLGNLRYVLPPLAADNLSTNTSGFSETPGSILYKYAFIYQYDGRKRCIAKKLPGSDWISFVYDKADRLILSQDGNQKIKNKWEANKYDQFGRLLYSGSLTSSNTRSQMETLYSGSFVNESYSGVSTNGGYTCSNLVPATLLNVNYFDNYDFLNRSAYSAIKNNLIKTIQSGYTEPDISHLRSLMTGTCAYHLDDSSKFELTSVYYDKYGRTVQMRSNNHLAGYDIIFHLVDFSGKPLKTYITHGINNASSTNKEVYTYTFDKAQRLLTTKHQLNEGNNVTLSTNTYNELGRLVTKNLGGNLVTTTYNYNVRGWVTDIVNDKFTENLYYNSNPVTLPDFTAAYNGNISGIKWSILSENNSFDRAYSFTYDALNRLTYSKYCAKTGLTTVTGSTGKYNEQSTYDKMGNITTLKRYEDGSLINNLTYSYTGNQLKKINDECSPVLLYGSEVFNDRAELETEYLFDMNGNNIYDANGGISTIRYNLLNLPEIIQFSAGHQNRYSYRSDGSRLKAVSYTLNSIIVVPQGVINPIPANPSDYIRIVTDHIGNKIYRNSTLMQIQTTEGYVQGSTYYYYIKDHLGNNRVVINNSGTIIEKSHYYPTGIRFYPVSTSNSLALPFRYNGKEFIAMNGLNWYDYGARFYDAQIGRWHVVDPLAEKYYDWTPYNYVGGNPVKRIDLFGLDWYTDKDGTYQYKDNVKSQDDLRRGQTYIGATYSIKDENGNVTTDYRKDSSIYFTNQTQAYNRMWNNAHKNNREELGVIMEDGVLVLPSHHNSSGNSAPALDDFGYAFKNGNFHDEIANSEKSFLATIHTHQNPTNNINIVPEISGDDIYRFTYDTPDKPFITMEFNNKVNGAIGRSSSYYNIEYYKYIQLKGLTVYGLTYGYYDLINKLKTTDFRKK